MRGVGGTPFANKLAWKSGDSPDVRTRGRALRFHHDRAARIFDGGSFASSRCGARDRGRWSSAILAACQSTAGRRLRRQLTSRSGGRHKSSDRFRHSGDRLERPTLERQLPVRLCHPLCRAGVSGFGWLSASPLCDAADSLAAPRITIGLRRRLPTALLTLARDSACWSAGHMPPFRITAERARNRDRTRAKGRTDPLLQPLRRFCRARDAKYPRSSRQPPPFAQT